MRVELTFEGKNGEERRSLAPDLSLESVPQLQDSDWYILPLVGPKRSGLTGIKFGATPLPRP